MAEFLHESVKTRGNLQQVMTVITRLACIWMVSGSHLSWDTASSQ